MENTKNTKTTGKRKIIDLVGDDEELQRLRDNVNSLHNDVDRLNDENTRLRKRVKELEEQAKEHRKEVQEAYHSGLRWDEDGYCQSCNYPPHKCDCDSSDFYWKNQE